MVTGQCGLRKETLQTQKLIKDIKQNITLIMIKSTLQIEHNNTPSMQKDILMVKANGTIKLNAHRYKEQPKFLKQKVQNQNRKKYMT